MANEWIEFAGGKRPVHGNVRVDVKLRDGRVIENYGASGYIWPWNEKFPERNIVAYRRTPK